MTDDELRDAIAFNTKRGLPANTDPAAFAQLVFAAQSVDKELWADGKYGDLTARLFGARSAPPKGDRYKPTPDPAVWANWVYPIDPIVLGGEARPFKISSGFTMYGKGEDPDRKNHWGVDLMLKRFEGDATETLRVNYPKIGVAQPPIWDPWWFCPHGIPIRAVGPGTVWSVHMGTNNNILIDHHNVPGFGPVTSWYQHMDRVDVHDGDELEAGQIIGTIGDGSSNLNHLHFEFRDHNRGGTREQSVVNPRQFLKLFRVPG